MCGCAAKQRENLRPLTGRKDNSGTNRQRDRPHQASPLQAPPSRLYLRNLVEQWQDRTLRIIDETTSAEGTMNRTVDGKFSRRLDPAKIEDGWHNRYAHEIAPLAQLYTADGESFTITYSSSWDVNSLKHSLQIEVHRLDPQCSITWSE
jgi:hypothetical protein